MLMVWWVPCSLAYHEGGYGDAELVPALAAGEIAELVEVHNQGRAEVEPTAANMNKVVWSHDLYAAAKDRVEECYYSIDIPVDMGHPLKVLQFTGISQTPTFDLVDSIDTWLYLGKESYNYLEDSCSRDPVFCNMYKLFTWAPMEEIGCAYFLCDELNNTYTNTVLPNVYYWKCNYYPVDDLEDANPYTSGTPCTACPDGSGWCNNEYDMCDSGCTPEGAQCDCLYADTCSGVYDYNSEECTCTCDHATCADDPFVCILKCGDPSWIVMDSDQGICHCDCPEGYETTKARDICLDVDECEEAGRCAHFCENTVGSYRCSCMPGFELDANGRTCTPFFAIGRGSFQIEEPSTTPSVPTPVKPTTSPQTSTEYISSSEPSPTSRPTTPCPVLDCSGQGTFDPETCTCNCVTGYSFDNALLTCTDIDECSLEDNVCEFCENTPGSYRCLACPIGFQLDTETGRCVRDVCSVGEGMFCSRNGFIDEQSCECVCHSGYNGDTCENRCAATDRTCWPSYEAEPPSDASHCDVYCPESECEGHLPCNNTGTLARAPGFQHIRNGVCLCYCPLPWSGEYCNECNLECEHGGTLDETTCTCTCMDGWLGIECSKPCVQKSRLCTGRTSSLCGEAPIIDDHCPIMCSVCTPVSDGTIHLMDGTDNTEGRIEIFLNKQWGTVCNDDWTLENVHVVCRQLNIGAAVGEGVKFGPGTGIDVLLDQVDCDGFEDDLASCDHNGVGVHNCDHTEDIGVRCSNTDPTSDAADGTLRLQDGSDETEGRVEVSYGGEWGTICDDVWDVNDAHVVCKQLGFSSGLEGIHEASFGRGVGLIMMDNVKCTGFEADISSCQRNAWLSHNCGHDEDASVRCSATDTSSDAADGALRLVDGSSITEGRVEISYGGQWGTVCDDYWDIDDAKVVCKQLGFPGAIEATSAASFGPGVGLILLDDVHCEGNEATLGVCNRNHSWTQHDCGHAEDAGVRCVPACSSSPCLNGGSCSEGLTGPECSCPVNFFGSICGCAVLHTPDVGDTRQYTFPGWPVPPGVTSLDFEVSADNDVHIGLSSIDGEVNNMYELGRLKLGHYGNDVPLMDVADPLTTQINYIGIWTGFGSEGDWKFHSFCST
ncbi:uncharacterized protein [Diadema antillarum]|uniref:uncharacterized protein n=1 Tax=Diadema antillarum TaxID=105358 RepID=UPI003A88E939